MGAADSKLQQAEKGIAFVRELFQQVIDDPRAAPHEKYTASVMLDEVSESEERIRRVRDDLAKMCRKDPGSGGRPGPRGSVY
jgi:hypothetical protein